MFKLKRLQQTGDTIVEVLICLAIVGSALTISYGTARRSLYQIQDAHERGIMLSLAQTELEILKANMAKDTHFTIYNQISNFQPAPWASGVSPIEQSDITVRSFCITLNGALQVKFTNPLGVTCAVNAKGQFYMDSFGAADTSDPAQIAAINVNYPYRVAITYRPYNASLLGAPPTRDKLINEWYVYGGRYGAGGYGNDSQFSVVPIMYRWHPNL